MGFLMPIAILVIRMSNKEQNGRRLKMIVYTHASLQVNKITFHCFTVNMRREKLTRTQCLRQTMDTNNYLLVERVINFV